MYGNSSPYLTHDIHSYTAKLIPQIPKHFIKKYTEESDVVLDPFCGSGTTLLEARLLSRNAIGIDINPLATLISSVKVTPLKIDQLSTAIRVVKEKVKKSERKTIVDFPNIGYWFCKRARNDLARIKASIECINDKFDKNIYMFMLACFSSIVRKSSNADPRMAKTYKSKRVIKRLKNGWTPTPIEYFEETLDRNFEKIKSLSEYLSGKNNYAKVFHGDARDTSIIMNKNGIQEVDSIITSPPYINAQDYFRSYKLEIWWLGLASPEEVRHLNRQAIGTENVSRGSDSSIPVAKNRILNTVLKEISSTNRRKSCIVHNYFKNMEIVFKEFYDTLKIGGHFCLITGNNTICGVKIPTYKILTSIAEDNGFKTIEISRDKIQNRTLPPNRNHDGGVIKEEYITVFQKESSR